jgi:hypothetical protein
MDPVKYLSLEAIESVFAHLSPKDVLRSFQVSRDWKNIIESSSRCMNKLKLKISGKWMSKSEEKDRETLIAPRKFSKVVIYDASEVLPTIYNIMRSTLHWKSVELFCTRFESTSEFMRVVRTFESTVEHLELHHIKIKNNDEDIKLNLRKLKSFSISLCSTKLCTAVLKDRQSIQSLNIGHFSPSEDLETIAESIKRLKNVTKFVACPMWFAIFFEDYKNDLKFKLEELTIGSNLTFNDIASLKIFSDAQKHFYFFLNTQMHTLKTLKLSGVFCVDNVKIGFKMSKLKTLVVPQLTMLSWNVVTFPASRSLKHLDIASIDSSKRYFIRKILNSSPQLESLRMQHVTKNKTIVLKALLQNLKQLTITKKYDDKVKKILPNVEWR